VGYSFKIGSMPTGTLWLAIASLFVGFGVEGAIWPLNSWLPDAHPAAPASISALLSGAVIKIGILAMVRFMYIVFAPVIATQTVLSVSHGYRCLDRISWRNCGIQTARCKRLLAFSSTAQVGYMVLGIFLGSPIGFVGGILHLFGHGLSKALAFLLTGEITDKVPDRDLNKAGGALSGISVAYSNLLSVLGLSSMPPFITFFSKLFILMGLIQRQFYWAAAVLAIGSIVEASYYGSYLAITSGSPLKWDRVSWRTVGYILLASGLVAISFLSPFVDSFSQGLLNFTAGTQMGFDHAVFNVAEWLINNGWMCYALLPCSF